MLVGGRCARFGVTMGILDSPLLLAAACALFYLAAGRQEGSHSGADPGPLWAILSATLSALVLVAFHAGWGWLLAVQVGLFFAIGAVRALWFPH